jgi:predicted site-specific integrase-resolvase
VTFFCELFGATVIPIKQPAQVTVEQQLVTDVLALMTSFTGKLHRRRRGRKSAKNGGCRGLPRVVYIG